jgi:hypothetical protein
MTPIKDRIAIATMATVLSLIVFEFMFPKDTFLENLGFAAGVSILYQVMGWSIELFKR